MLLGGGSDREQAIVCQNLLKIQKQFQEYVEDNGVVIAVCGGYQLLGRYYKTDDGMIEGLNLVDIYTEQEEGRLIDNIVLQSELADMPIVGFENHGGRTYINDNKPFGKVLYGSGNDGKSGYEGVVYKNVIGTYLHGPLPVSYTHLRDKGRRGGPVSWVYRDPQEPDSIAAYYEGTGIHGLSLLCG